MPCERSIRQQIGNQSSTYHSRQREALKEDGQNEKPTKVVGADPSPYPKSSGPWSDPTARVLDTTADPTGYDQTSAPVIGQPFEVEEAALMKQIARLQHAQRSIDPADPRVDEIQVQINAAMAALDRGRK